MFDVIAGRPTPENSQAAAPTPPLDHPAQNLIQCRQCSEQFAKATVFCPRCHRWNDRSMLALSVRIFAVVLFIAAISWTVWAILKADRPPTLDGSLQPLSKGSPASANQPDVRF